MITNRLSYGQNDRFFRGRRQSAWWMVAYGMVGASISAVTFVGVPGMVLTEQMTYLQTCLGFILGYVAVAFVLMPLYYRSGQASIYALLEDRLDSEARRAASAVFLVAKMGSAAVRFYVAVLIVHQLLPQCLGLPFAATALCMALAIWLYTRRGGIHTLVRTDVVLTTCMLLALVLIIYRVTRALDLTLWQAAAAVSHSPLSRVFVFDDWLSPQCFVKQFLSGIFIVVVMTGLDQDMMQKNLTCRSLRQAQLDLCSYGLAFVPVNALFLALGVLLTMLAARWGMPLPARGDELLPLFAATGRLGTAVLWLFAIGVVSASMSSADSALTALTTTYCVDLRQRPDDVRLRRRAHLTLTLLFAAVVTAVDALRSPSVVSTIYTLVGYAYGPLLGLFAYALLRPRHRSPRAPLAAYMFIAIAAPAACGLLTIAAQTLCHYRFGYELLLLNGTLTYAMLSLLPARVGNGRSPRGSKG